MKIGIITINDFNNYGNRLQNYAVQKILNDYNFVSETLKNDSFSNTKSFYLLRKIKNFNYKGSYSYNDERKNNFSNFNKYLSFSENKINPFSHLKNFDYFICGSDQVWNPDIGRLREVDLLSFAPSEKRISFSASFGVDKIPEKYKNKSKKELSKFKSISVREDAGKKIVEDLTGRTDVEVLVDPTMLLSSKEWDKVSKKPKQLKTDKYILNYFLGKLSEERRKEIDRIANENNCEVIDILDEKSPFYSCGPSEFLYLEKNAFLICTDSFHSSVFAIIYDRPFVVFEREDKIESMNSRIETLLNKFNLNDRKYNGKITPRHLKHNYSNAYKILELEKKKSKTFLEKALNIKCNNKKGDVKGE